jgi:hypothetical membrane protein
MKKFYYLGIVGSIVYVLSVILGGLLWPGYSHVSQSISTLIMTTSPNQIFMQPLFWIYNLLLVAFSIGYYRWSQNILIKISAAFLFLVALSGILMLIFPQDAINAPLSAHGLAHLIFAGVAALSTLVAIFLSAIGLWGRGGYKKLGVLSLVFGLVILITGPLTAMAPTAFPQYFGLSERITIGSFIVWWFVLSYTIHRSERKAKK